MQWHNFSPSENKKSDVGEDHASVKALKSVVSQQDPEYSKENILLLNTQYVPT